jgi:phospholipid/cholesterol/gamma-HCH transport system ATP-binding protein
VSNDEPHIRVSDLVMAYGSHVIARDLNFTIARGEVFVIMGGSGCGKSTLMRHLLGLQRPAGGQVFVDGVDIWALSQPERDVMLRRCGVLFQAGALWSSMTLADNVALPLQEYTDLPPEEIEAQVMLKLAFVGLAGSEDRYPSELSGGMQKRAGLARAIALDPGLLFCDEPSAGLDPITSRRLDDLIVTLSRSVGTTVVIVTHELESLLSIGTDAIFLDPKEKRIVARGKPATLRDTCDNPTVRQFLHGGRDHGTEG